MSSVASDFLQDDSFEDAGRSSSRRASRGSVRGDLALFHRGLADLCRAQVPLPRALRILQSDLERGPMARAAAEMADEIEQGTPLVEAYSRHQDRFSPVYRALITAGMGGGGALPDVLDEIAGHASLRTSILEQMRRTMAYPLVATGFVVLVGAALLVFVGSPLGGALGLDPELSSTRGSGWQAWSGVGVAALALVGIAVWSMLRKSHDDGVGPAAWSWKLPLIGRIKTFSAKASFASTLALLLRRSIPLPQAMRLTATATDSPAIRSRVERMAEAAESGSGLTDSVEAGGLISPSLSWFLEAAANEQAAADALDDIASIYRQRLERSADRVALIAAPAAQLLVGLVVLGFALTYMTGAVDLGALAENGR